MYRHLLVPLDDSALASDTVRKAVEFARALGAKVTFFHAEEDYGATSIGALQRVVAPAEFNESMAGDARAILSKAEVVAREAAVPYGSVSVTSNRPHEAILDAVNTHGCDLIFIASHGRRGLKGVMLGSETQKVLQHTTVPVLVSAIESNMPLSEMAVSLAIIGDEHRSLAAIIHRLQFIARESWESGKPPSFDLLHAMLHYIEEFPERLHHPKEDLYLFRKLRARTSGYDEALVELERQHVEGRRLVAELAFSIAHYESDPVMGFGPFASAVEHFARAQMAHMRLETKVILPAARKHLTADDWAEIAHAFADNSDPRFSIDNDEELRQLFARIINFAPV